MRLVSGSGSPETGACWMSAVHWYTRGEKRSWTDHPECVSDVVRKLCIQLNDTLRSDEEREEVIGPHLFEPVGTKTTEEDEEKRRAICADRAIHVFAPYWIRKSKVHELLAYADRLEKYPKIVTREDAKRAIAFMDEVHKQAQKASAYTYTYSYAYGCAYSYAYAYASDSTYNYAYASTYDSAYDSWQEEDRTWFKREIIRLILDLCAVGRKAEAVCATKSREEVVEFLCSFDKR